MRPNAALSEVTKRWRARVLMTTDAVGGVWRHAVDLAAGLAPHAVAHREQELPRRRGEGALARGEPRLAGAEVRHDERAVGAVLRIGPRRVVPVSLLALEHAGDVGRPFEIMLGQIGRAHV